MSKKEVLTCLSCWVVRVISVLVDILLKTVFSDLHSFLHSPPFFPLPLIDILNGFLNLAFSVYTCSVPM